MTTLQVTRQFAVATIEMAIHEAQARNVSMRIVAHSVINALERDGMKIVTDHRRRGADVGKAVPLEQKL